MALFKTYPLYGEAFLRLFFPSLCALCEGFLGLHQRGLCEACAAPLSSLKFFPSEERIRLPLKEIDRGWALFRYEGIVKEILHKIKFDRRRDLVKVFLSYLAEFSARRLRESPFQALIPIPLDPRRRLVREFNPAGLLARALGTTSGIPLEKGILHKGHPTLPQSSLGREARRINLRRAFCTSSAACLEGRSFLLVDDIITTGATMEEAAQTLKAQGAVEIGCVALARASGD